MRGNDNVRAAKTEGARARFALSEALEPIRFESCCWKVRSQLGVSPEQPRRDPLTHGWRETRVKVNRIAQVQVNGGA